MTYLEAIVLGLVQGLTEFLPVSSSGHLVLMNDVLGVIGGGSLAFDAILHLATAGAIIVYFHKDLWILVQAMLRKLGRLPVNQRDVTLVYALLISMVPAAIVGVLLEDIIATAFRSPVLVACSLLAGSALFIYAEWRYFSSVPQNNLTVRTGLLIGLFQVLSLVPGFSRSGATIAGGMLLGLSRSEAARFAFLMAIPLMLGAGSKKLIDLINSGESVSWLVVIAGSATAFVVGLLAIRFMLAFVRQYTLWPFIWYRIALASLVLFLYFI
jgi:undecaprenyl-diphosphatase